MVKTKRKISLQEKQHPNIPLSEERKKGIALHNIIAALIKVVHTIHSEYKLSLFI